MDMGKMGFAAFTYGPDLPIDTWLDFSANIRVRPNGNVETACQCATPMGSSIQRQIGTPQTSYTTLPAVIEHAGWWALVEGAAAALEQAANHIGDLEAERAALGAAKHYRERANDLYRDGKAQDNRPSAAPSASAPKDCHDEDDLHN